MDFLTYQLSALRTMAYHLTDTEGIHVSAMGLASEVGEICSEVKKAAEQCREIDKAKIAEEAGDALWYISDLLSRLGLHLDGVALENIAKLQRRHPRGFTVESSIAQADKHTTPSGGAIDTH